jgi:hypothetical protein
LNLRPLPPQGSALARLRHAPTFGATVIERGRRGVNRADCLRPERRWRRMQRMVRPLRKLWRIRTVVRRRHRTWMISMTCASLGWASWWVTAALLHFKPSWAPSIDVTDQLAITFALLGFIAALLSIRARLAWLLVVSVPLFANLSVLLIPFTLNTWRINAAGQIVHDDDTSEQEAPRAPPEKAHGRSSSELSPVRERLQRGQ